MSCDPLFASNRRCSLVPKALILLPLWLLLAACESTLERAIFDGHTMGTTYRITLSTEEPISAVVSATLAAEFDNKLIYINSLMSTYDPFSEISRFNKGKAGQCHAVSEETRAVIDQSDAVRQNEWCFRPNCRSSSQFMGFGPERQIGNPPDPELVVMARQQTGFDAIELGCEAGGLIKAMPREIDLSAIARDSQSIICRIG